MKIRNALGLALAAVLGAATVVLPARAGSETTQSVVAENLGLYTHAWKPPSITVAAGGVVEFSNPTAVAHGIHWISTPGGAPPCAGSVPVGTDESASGTNWKGSCTFADAGTYVYYCTVHGSSMSGSVTVPGATTTGTTPSAGGPTTSSATETTPSPGATNTSGSAGTQLIGVKLATRRGGSVHGSLSVGSAAVGGTLTVTLTARLAGHRVPVGRLVRSHLTGGSQTWSISLSPGAKRALRAKRRLAVTVRITLTASGEAPVVVTRTLTVRS